MAFSDPISDMCTRIRNGQSAGLAKVVIPSSKLKIAIAEVLKEEGYILEYGLIKKGAPNSEMVITLKYFQGRPVINRIERYSKPGKRMYRDKASLPTVLGGHGLAIVSTPKGVVSDKAAKEYGHGGEVLCVIE